MLRHGQIHKHQSNLSSLSMDSRATSLITSNSTAVTTATSTFLGVDGSPLRTHGSPAGSNISDNSSIMFNQSHSQIQSHNNARGEPINAAATTSRMQRSAGMRVLESIDEMGAATTTSSGANTSSSSQSSQPNGLSLSIPEEANGNPKRDGKSRLDGGELDGGLEGGLEGDVKEGGVKYSLQGGLDVDLDGDGDDEGSILRVLGSPSSWSTPPNSPPRSGTNTPLQYHLKS